MLSPVYEPGFSKQSYGFRPSLSAQDAVIESRKHVQGGKRWVFDMDLSKFFDEVHHERLLNKLRIRIGDNRVVHLIHRYLRAGKVENGIEEKRSKGSPQGSPLSPLLSNIVLDEMDKELERRGHSFVRYADDFQIYVGSKRSAERVSASLGKFIEKKLKLKMNKSKSRIDRPWNLTFLGYSLTVDKTTKLRVPKESIQRFKKKAKAKFREGRGRNLGRFIKEDLNPLIRGWVNYFSSSDTKGFLCELDSWLRRHLRKIRWRQQKRGWKRLRTLISRGLTEERAVRSAFNQRGAWWNSGASHMNLAYPQRYFVAMGLLSMDQIYRRNHLNTNLRNRRDT